MKTILLPLTVLMAVILPLQAQQPIKKARNTARRNSNFEHRFADDLKQTADSKARQDLWFRDAKFGAFIHFGVYSTLEGEYKGRGSQHRYSEWIQISGKIPAEEYHQVAAQFNPAEFDADEWARTFKACGIRYVVITSKHHDGFALFKSKVSNYNIVDFTPFKRDIIKELSEACHRHGLKFGVYYSQAQDWDEPDAPLISAAKEKFRWDVHPDLPKDYQPDMDRYIAKKSLPQVEELVKNYELDLIWFDTPAGMNMERVKLFSNMVRKYRPDCLINSRIIHSGRGKIEAQYLPYYDYVSIGDKEVPTKKLPLYVESPDSVSSSFGYKTKGNCYYHSEKEMLHRFVHTVCAGGNALINNGPMGNGKLDPEAVRIYGAMGDWLKVNGESIYGSVRNPLDERPEWGDISASKDGKTLYLHILEWPESGSITVNGLSSTAASAVYLANGEKAAFVQEGDTLKLTLPALPLNEYDTVVKVLLKKLAGSVAGSESAKNAWANLAGRFANRPEFAFVENNPALPNVLIYGDSISIGYTQRVRAKIGGQANVYRLYHNGGSSRSFIPMMTKMHNTMRDEQLDKPWTFQWDVIHFNVGLHDLTVRELDKENGKHVLATPIDVYKKNFGDIVTYLQLLAPNAKLIFATTTPVPEGTFGPRRIAGDAQRYNAAAFEVLRKTPDIAVNDLYSFTKPNHPEWWSEPGNVHYNETGKNAQGDEVARVILNAIRTLSPSASVGAQESAENAWANLAGKFVNRPEFAFIENNPALPNVLIYGDSISIGYTQRLRGQLKNQANVYRLYCNGGDSGSFIGKMAQMHTAMCDENLDAPWTFEWDVIQFNVGLHDLKYLSSGKLDKEHGVQVSSPEVYKKNLRDIVAYLKKLAPNAKLIFATTTPVPDGAQGRFAGDAAKYNQAAVEVLRDFPEITINDLFTFTKANQPQWWSKPGDVHYNGAGKNAQGDEVARIIRKTFSSK